MFDSYFLEFDLDMKKCDHIFETASDKLDVTALELFTFESSGLFNESEDPDEMFAEAAGKFIDAIKTFFRKIKDAIKKLYLSIKDAIENSIRKHEMKKKMKELREMIKSSQELQKALGSSSSEIVDSTKLYKIYCAYMDEMVKQTRQVYSKTYDNIDDYNNAVKKANDALAEKADELNMTVSDKSMVSMKFGEAFKFTEKESDNISKLTEMYVKKWTTSTDELEKVVLAQDDASKISDLKTVVSKINSVMSQGLRKMEQGWQKNYKAIIAAATAVGATAGIVGVGVKTHQNSKKFDSILSSIENMK